MYGPTNNPRLSEILTKAIRAGFPKASIEKAIARGQGKSATGAQLETVTLEGVLPGNVAVVVESETDNRIRTLATLRLILKQAGGSASPCAYLFNKRGRIWFEAKEGIGEEEALEAALEAGASDVAEDDEEGSIVVWCEPGETKAVSEAVASSLGLQISTTDIVWVPVEETKIDVSPHTAQGLSKFADDLQERDSTLNAQATVNIRPGSLGDEAWVDLCKTLDARDVRYV